jgi:hypothetical protein
MAAKLQPNKRHPTFTNGALNAENLFTHRKGDSMLKKYRIYGYARVYVDVAAFDEEDAFMSAQGTDLSDYVIERLDAVEEIEDVN